VKRPFTLKVRGQSVLSLLRFIDLNRTPYLKFLRAIYRGHFVALLKEYSIKSVTNEPGLDWHFKKTNESVIIQSVNWCEQSFIKPNRLQRAIRRQSATFVAISGLLRMRTVTVLQLNRKICHLQSF